MKSTLVLFGLMAATAAAFTSNSIVIRKASALLGKSVVMVIPSHRIHGDFSLLSSPCHKCCTAYVPDGMSPEQWKKLQEKEKSEKAKKNFAAFGPQSFKSRSLQSFQKELEKGKADHLMPVLNAKEKVKAGQIRPEDIPYMQRGGAWDNSDVKTAKKIQWNDDDKKYNPVVTKTNGLDWSGAAPRMGPGKASATKQAEQTPVVRKLFGMF
jgi:hypothetical protein